MSDGSNLMRREMFSILWGEAQELVNHTAKEKGWWDEDRNEGEIIALMHSELSEALEAIRIGNPPSEKIPEHSSLDEELADVVIRIMDYAQHRGVVLADVILAKIDYNQSRPFKHGGKKF